LNNLSGQFGWDAQPERPGCVDIDKHFKAAGRPAITAEVRAMIETLDLSTLSGIRDRGLLLVGFAGAFRRSELVSLDVSDSPPLANGRPQDCPSSRICSTAS
jgi:hypothetical protein